MAEYWGNTMQKIDSIIAELKMIMQNNDITQTKIVNILDGKCARNTILTFFKGDHGETDPRLSTLLMILDACGVQLRLETERSREAILSGDIAAYRAEVEQMRSELEEIKKSRDFLQERYTELIEKNTTLTNAVEKQQGQIERYMLRMEKAENALYDANDNIKRKDAKIVELLEKYGSWK